MLKVKSGEIKQMTDTDNDNYKMPLSPVSAVSSIVHDNGKVLLILRGKQPNKGMWSLPGGRQNFGERLKHAALRELKEETSLIAQDASLVTVFEAISHNTQGSLGYHANITVFKVSAFSGSISAGDDAIDVMWASKADLGQLNMTPDTADIIIETLGDLFS